MPPNPQPWPSTHQSPAPPCLLQAVRDQIRKLAVGGPQSKEEKANVYEVADSDDEDLALEEQGWVLLQPACAW